MRTFFRTGTLKRLRTTVPKSMIGSLHWKHAENQQICHGPPPICREGRAPYFFGWVWTGYRFSFPNRRWQNGTRCFLHTSRNTLGLRVLHRVEGKSWGCRPPGCQPPMTGKVRDYMVTSLIRNSASPWNHHRTLGICLL
jgi:hypothetical protein